MVVPGALSALTVVAQALVGRGDRVLVESPGYPNAHEALRRAGARRVGGPDGRRRLGPRRGRPACVREARPRLAYLIPDFQNPTGNLMSNAEREQYAALLRRAGTVAVVDESHQPLALDGRPMPRPFAAFAPETTITLGSASKSFWGGLRVGWIRCPADVLERLIGGPGGARPRHARCCEQLVAARLLGRREELWADQPRPAARAARRPRRGALASGCRTGGSGSPAAASSLWCELPPSRPTRRRALALAAEAERRGVVVSPGPVFAVDGGLDSFVRIPFTRPADELRDAVDRLAEAWAAVSERAHRRSDAGPAYPRDGRLSRHAARRGSDQVDGAQRGRVDRLLDLGERLGRDRRVDRQRDEGVAALAVAGDLHAGDVDLAVAEDPADGADHARDGRRR